MTITFFRKACSAFILVWIALSLAACGFIDNKANAPLSSAVKAGLAMIGSAPGEGMVVRIFKQESQLEVWKRSKTGQYRLFKTYEICTFSGVLGPKIKEGDRQSPEGFYTITPGLMNPKSSYYLAFNTGFPNKFDRAYGRTGSNLMVHGDCSSSGCYAMTDEGIAEIYALARETFKGGNPSFQVQIYPFRMTAANLAKEANNPHMGFWNNIKDGYDLFEIAKIPANWDVCDRQYVFNVTATGPLDPIAACPVMVRDPALVAKQASDAVAVAAVHANTAKVANERAVVAARGQAINGFFGSMFGGGQPVAVAAATPVEAPVLISESAPVPALAGARP